MSLLSANILILPLPIVVKAVFLVRFLSLWVVSRSRGLRTKRRLSCEEGGGAGTLASPSGGRYGRRAARLGAHSPPNRPSRGFPPSKLRINDLSGLPSALISPTFSFVKLALNRLLPTRLDSRLRCGRVSIWFLWPLMYDALSVRSWVSRCLGPGKVQ